MEADCDGNDEDMRRDFREEREEEGRRGGGRIGREKERDAWRLDG